MRSPSIYTEEAIEENEAGDRRISIQLGGENVELPVLLVGSCLLAWIDPRREEIIESGANALALLLAEVQPTLCITPASSKSIPMISRAVELYSVASNKQTPLLVLSGGKDLEAVRSQAGEGSQIVGYNPVTSPESTKYVGLSVEYAEKIQQALEKGGSVAILDDVFSTGATIEAIRTAIRNALNTEVANTQLPVVVVSREVVGDYQEQHRDDVYSAVVLPVVLR